VLNEIAVTTSYEPAWNQSDEDYTSEREERILVVDDDYTSLQSAINLLRLEGYSVTSAMNGTEALRRIKEDPDFHLIILDVMMPGISGYQVCKKIRETKSFADLPVLMV